MDYTEIEKVLNGEIDDRKYIRYVKMAYGHKAMELTISHLLNRCNATLESANIDLTKAPRKLYALIAMRKQIMIDQLTD